MPALRLSLSIDPPDFPPFLTANLLRSRERSRISIARIDVVIAEVFRHVKLAVGIVSKCELAALSRSML